MGSVWWPFIHTLLVAACLMILLSIASTVSATSVGSTDTTVTTTTTFARPTTYLTAAPGNLSESRTVYQGNPYNPEVVCWNETVDLTLVQGWYGMLVRLPYGNTVDVSTFTRKIFVDPAVFPEGFYYQWSPFEERAGNTLSFEVRRTCPLPVPGFSIENKTVVLNESFRNITQITNYKLPERHIADIFVARGDGFAYNNTLIVNNTRIWLFGRTDSQYDVLPRNGSFELNSSEVDNLEVGEYKVVLVNRGIMTVPQLSYNVTKEQIRYDVPPPLDIRGYSPLVAYEKFKDWMQMYSDDNLTEIGMVVEYPKIEITNVDETEIPGIYGNESIATPALDISGYTNVAHGSKVWALLDEERRDPEEIAYMNATSEAYGPDVGMMREFRVRLPFFWNDTAPGEHFLTVHTVHDAYSRISFWVYDIPEGQERPKAYMRYINGNLFVPTPTPQVITKIEVHETVREVVRYLPAPTPTPTPPPPPPPVPLQQPWVTIEGLVVFLVVVWLVWKYVL